MNLKAEKTCKSLFFCIFLYVTVCVPKKLIRRGHNGKPCSCNLALLWQETDLHTVAEALRADPHSTRVISRGTKGCLEKVSGRGVRDIG